MKKRILSLAMVLVMCLSLLPANVFAAGEGPVAINDINFPDPYFLAYVKTLPGAEDGSFTETELAAITEIRYDGESVPRENRLSNVIGIEHFTALQKLEVPNNQLTELDVSHCPALTHLDLTFNSLRTLDLSQNLALTYLDCSWNSLTDLDVSQHTALTYLNCSCNNLPNLDVSRNIALTTLECYNTQITSLDISPNTALTSLKCDTNPLKVLDISVRPGLTYLDCAYCELTELDVSQNPALTYLEVSDNQLTSLNVSSNPELLSLGCGYNQLTELDVRKNAKLTSLSCANNALNSLDVTQNPALDSLYCDNCQLTSLDISGNLELVELYCSNNPLNKLDISKHTKLQELGCDSTQLTKLDIHTNTELTSLTCDNNPLYTLDVTTHPALSVLHCANCQLSELNVTQNPALTYLFCDKNQLTELDVSQNPALQTLQCSNNYLTSMDLSGLPELRWVFANDNRRTLKDGTTLAEMDANFDPAKASNIVGGNFDGGKVHFTADSLTYDYDCGSGTTSSFKLIKADPALADGVAINAKNFPDANFLAYVKTLPGAADGIFTQKELGTITRIDCNSYSDQGKISDLTGIAYFTELTELYCNNNRLTSLDLSKNPELKELFCDSNELTSLDLSKNPKLMTLFCDKNQLTELDVSHNPELSDLRVEGNYLTYLDTTKNPKLMHLNCYDNRRFVKDGTEVTAMGSGFDPTRTSNIMDGNFDGGKVNYTSGHVMTYDYDCGNGYIFSFQLINYDLAEYKTIAVDETNFPDPNFLAYVKTLPGAEDGVLDPFELSAYTEIDCSVEDDKPDEEKISDLTGIEHFFALKSLRCRGNLLTSLDLSKNTALACVEMVHNQRTVENGTELAAMDAKLDITKVGRMYGGSFDGGKVNFTYPSMTYDYDCGNGVTVEFTLNQILYINETTFPDANFRAYVKTLPGAEDGVFTAKELMAIREIRCSGLNKPVEEQISDLTGIENFADITYLDCSNNLLTELDLSRNQDLTFLDCSENRLLTLGIEKNYVLKELNCSGNQLTALDVFSMWGLNHLECVSNQRIVPNGMELTAMNPDFDPARATNLVGGSFQDGKVNFTADELTYTYDCRNGKTANFKLVRQEPVVTEATVTFRVVDGTWMDSTTADKTVPVTLYDGKGTLPADAVPTGMIANPGFENGNWDVVPTTGADAITGNVTYTYTFQKMEPVEYNPITVSFTKSGVRCQQTIWRTVAPGESIKAPRANNFRWKDRVWLSEEGGFTVEPKGTVTYEQLLELLGGTAQEGAEIHFNAVSRSELPDPESQTILLTFTVEGFGTRFEEIGGKVLTVALEPGESVTAPFVQTILGRIKPMTWVSTEGIEITSGDVIDYETLAQFLGGDVTGGTVIFFRNA